MSVMVVFAQYYFVVSVRFGGTILGTGRLSVYYVAFIVVVFGFDGYFDFVYVHFLLGSKIGFTALRWEVGKLPSSVPIARHSILCVNVVGGAVDDFLFSLYWKFTI